MVTTMKRLLAALLLLTSVGSAEAQQWGSSTIETTASSLTASSNIFTPPCPVLGGAAGVYNVVATAANQTIAVPACPSSSVGLFATFNICNGKGGTTPCNGTTSGPFSPGLAFGTGFEFPSSSGPYTVSTGNANNVSGAKDIVTCEVMGTGGPWSCGAPQYAVVGSNDIWQAAGSAGCNSGIVLSNGSLTASQPNNTGNIGCLATTSHTTGQYYFFLTVVSSDTTQGWISGIANASANLSSYLGSDNNGIALKSTQFFFNNGGTQSTGPTFTTGAVIRYDVDLTNKQLGVNISGTEYPSGCVITTPSGCFSFSTWAGGAAFPAFSGSDASAADTATLNTTSGAGPGGSFVLWQ